MTDFTKALETLRSGGIILYPTDTVWGLGCDATDSAAVARIFALKRRLESKSLVLLVSDPDMLCRYIREVPPVALDVATLATTPTTVIYPGAICTDGPGKDDRFHLAWNTVAEDGSVAIRIPLMDYCVSLVRKFGRPIVSTSANISGEPTPKCFAEISKEIIDGVDYVEDASEEKASCGKPSSIIKINLDSTFKIIR